jgi:polysaccharide pyruvyl transferase WcaK-like protein
MPSVSDERFFLFGFYGQSNLGDDLLLRATVEGIRRIRPRATFAVRNEGPIRGLDDFGDAVELTGIDRILADQSKSKVRRLVETLLAYRRYFSRCHWFVFGGGTVFHERTSAAPMLLTLMICALARVMGLRIAALGVGISELKTAPARFALRMIISMSALFTVRDEAAFTECAKVGASKLVKLTSDLAFTLAPALAGRGGKTESRTGRYIGFSVYPPVLISGAAAPSAMLAVHDALSALLDRGWTVSLLAFHDDPGKANGCQDKDVLTRLMESFSPDQKSLVRQRVLRADAGEISRLFSEIDVHCGMRFHGHVLAAMFSVPFVGISTDNKTDSICRLFGMPVVSADRFAAGDLLEAIERAGSKKVDMSLREACIAGAEQNFFEFARLLSPNPANA